MKTVRLINRILFAAALISLMIIKQTISGNDYLLGYLGFFLFILLFPLASIELYFLIFRKKRSPFVLALLVPLSCFLTIQIWWFFGSWSADIENVLRFPEGYDKPYGIVVYGIEEGESIEPSFSIKRKREIHFPNNGVYLTSTLLESTMDAINHPDPTVFIGEKQLQKSEWLQSENKWSKGFWISNSSKDGYLFKFIDLNHAGYYPDSVLKADKIRFSNYNPVSGFLGASEVIPPSE